MPPPWTLCRRPIIEPGPSCAADPAAAACGSCRGRGPRTDRVAHRPLDGAHNAPPTGSTGPATSSRSTRTTIRVTPRRSPSRRFSPERDRLWTGFWMFLRSGSEFVRQGNGLAVGECGAGGGEQVELRLDACELGRFEQAVEQRSDLGAALGARAVMIFPAQNHTAQATLRGVVVERDARVVEEERQALPQTQHVGDGLAKPALRQGP